MALTYPELSATTQKYYVPKLVDNIFTSNALLQRLRNKSYRSQEGGTTIMVPVLYALTSAGGWYTGTDTLSTTANEQITAAEFVRAHIYANITVTHTDELQNSGDAQMVDFVRSKVQSAEMTLADNMGTGIYNAGTNAKAIIGLGLGVASAAGTYGGISRGSYTWWCSQIDSTTTTLTLPALQFAMGKATVGNDKPTVSLTTQTLYDTYINLLTPVQRFMDEETAKAGFTNAMFNGMPVIVDNHCTANYWYLLNEKYLTLYYHPRDNFRFEPFIKPVDQAVATAKIFWAGQMVISNCRMQSVLTALTS